MYRMHVNSISIMLFVFLLTMGFIACGGGGDGDDSTDTSSESVLNDDTAVPGEESVLRVIETDPSNGSLGVPRDAQISVTFNEDVDPRTITDLSFMILVKGVRLNGVITWLNNVVTFTPRSPLASNTTYTGRVTMAVRDLDENPLHSDFIWSFTTL